jgi:hypothetical protein
LVDTPLRRSRRRAAMFVSAPASVMTAALVNVTRGAYIDV